MADAKQYSLAVIVTDAEQAANCGGGMCETTVRVFTLPSEISEYINQSRTSGYITVAVELAVNHD